MRTFWGPPRVPRLTRVGESYSALRSRCLLPVRFSGTPWRLAGNMCVPAEPTRCLRGVRRRVERVPTGRAPTARTCPRACNPVWTRGRAVPPAASPPGPSAVLPGAARGPFEVHWPVARDGARRPSVPAVDLPPLLPGGLGVGVPASGGPFYVLRRSVRRGRAYWPAPSGWGFRNVPTTGTAVEGGSDPDVLPPLRLDARRTSARSLRVGCCRRVRQWQLTHHRHPFRRSTLMPSPRAFRGAPGWRSPTRAPSVSLWVRASRMSYASRRNRANPSRSSFGYLKRWARCSCSAAVALQVYVGQGARLWRLRGCRDGADVPSTAHVAVPHGCRTHFPGMCCAAGPQADAVRGWSQGALRTRGMRAGAMCTPGADEWTLSRSQLRSFRLLSVWAPRRCVRLPAVARAGRCSAGRQSVATLHAFPGDVHAKGGGADGVLPGPAGLPRPIGTR